MKDLYLGAKFHDVGKRYINPSLLCKKKELSKLEIDQLKLHSELSYRALKKGGFFNQRILLAVREHHERIDGKGYPKGLKGSEISHFGKILTLCDSYEAMTNKRCYKDKSLSKEDAIEEVKRNLGTQFDEKLGIKFINYLKNTR